MYTTFLLKSQISPCFEQTSNYTAGDGPFSIFSADFNGDGKADLVSANHYGNNVSVLLGNGAGSFSSAVNYSVGLDPYSVFGVDFNGDNNVDLAIANNNSSNVSVLLGSGTGTFSTAVNYSVGFNPNSIFSADFNGDGYKDIVTSRSNGVSILLNNGTASFSAAVSYTTVPFGTSTKAVISADFNGDGKADLATANSGNSGFNLSVLLGSGTGAFSSAVIYTVGPYPNSICTADFNGDGNLDLATANSGGSNVSVLLGSGTGAFSTAVNYVAGFYPNSIFSADFNGDGKPDIATANSVGGGTQDVSVLLGSGNGAFSTAIQYSVSSNPVSITSADFNGDGKADIATANTGIDDVSVLLSSNFPTITVNSGAICSGNSFTISPSGAETYTYSGGSSVVSPTASTNYTVIGENLMGCISIAAVCVVSVNTCVGIDELAEDTTVKICPNPSSGIFTIGIKSTSTQLLQIVDITGKVVLSQTLNNNNTSINASDLPNGVYTVFLTENYINVSKRLVILK